jgi:alpha-glucosidase
VCVVNCGAGPAKLPAEAGELLISSGEGPDEGRLPEDTAAWFRAG